MVPTARRKRQSFRFETPMHDALGVQTVLPQDGLGRGLGARDMAQALALEKTARDSAGFVTAKTVGDRTYSVIMGALGKPLSLKSGDAVDVSSEYDSAGRVVRRVDAVLGTEESWAYADVLGRVTRYTRRVPGASGLVSTLTEDRTYVDSPGGVTTVTVTRAVATTGGLGAPAQPAETETLQVDALGRLLSRTETVTGSSTEQTTRFAYDGLGRLVKRTWPGGAEEAWEYDEAGRLLRHTDEAGHQTRYSYDLGGVDVTVRGPHPEARVDVRHDGLGRPVEQVVATGPTTTAVTRTKYGVDGWTTTEDAEGFVTKTRRNGLGQVVETLRNTERDGGIATEVSTTVEWNGDRPKRVSRREAASVHGLTLVEDAAGRPQVTEEFWNLLGGSTHAWTYTTQHAWTGRHAIVRYDWHGGGTPPSAHALELDGLGNTVRETMGSGADAVTEAQEYDALARLVAQRPSGVTHLQQAHYGVDGRLARMTQGTEDTVYTYTPRGLLKTQTTPDGRTQTLTYEAGGTKRPLVVTETHGKATAGEVLTTMYAHDEAGMVKEKTVAPGAEGVTTLYDVGPRGELRSVTQPSGAQWRYGYDGLARLTQVTPPAGSGRPAETLRYDGLNRRTYRALGVAVWLTTWAAGAATTTAGGTGNQEEVKHDGRGRPVAVVYRPGAEAGAGVTEATYRYGGDDGLEMMVEGRASGATTTAYVRDGARRLTGVTRTGEAGVGFTYRAGSRLEETASVGGSTVSRDYDEYGRVRRVSGAWGDSYVEWEAGGGRLRRVGSMEGPPAPGVYEATYEYTGQGWLRSIASPAGSWTYSHDGRGNPTRQTGPPGVRQFAYDSDDRLTAVQEWDGHIEGWKLLGDGARGEAKRWPATTGWTAGFSFETAGHSAHEVYGYGATGAVVSVASASGVATFGVDGEGRTTSEVTPGRPTRTYQWDVASRLVQLEEAGSAALRFEYDGLGKRRAASDGRRWQWVGSREVGEGGDVLGTAAGLRLGEGARRYHNDGLGSVVAVEEAGATTTASYSAWGQRSGSSTASAGYAGARTEGWLSFHEDRYLSPERGQWLSVDGLGAAERLGFPNDLSPYLYGAGNPSRYTDTTGREGTDTAGEWVDSICAAVPTTPGCAPEDRAAWVADLGTAMGMGAVSALAVGGVASGGVTALRLAWVGGRVGAGWGVGSDVAAQWAERHRAERLGVRVPGWDFARMGAGAVSGGALGAGFGLGGMLSGVGQVGLVGVGLGLGVHQGVQAYEYFQADNWEMGVATGGSLVAGLAMVGVAAGRRAADFSSLGRAVDEGFAEFAAETRNGADVAMVFGQRDITLAEEAVRARVLGNVLNSRAASATSRYSAWEANVRARQAWEGYEPDFAEMFDLPEYGRSHAGLGSESPRLFWNSDPSQAWRRETSGLAHADASGRWWLTLSSGKRVSPRGRFNFVVQDGRLRLAKIKPSFDPKHVDIAQGRAVEYAGSVQFGRGKNSGRVREWSNNSGHYLPSADAASQAPFALQQFRPHPEVP